LAGSFTNDDQSNAPTTSSPYGSYVDGQDFLVAINNISTLEIQLWKFDMVARIWSIVSASGIITSGSGSAILLQKRPDGKFVVVYYSGAAQAAYTLYDPVGDTWGTPVTMSVVGGISPYIRALLVDSANVYHSFYCVNGFVNPPTLHHQAYIGDVAQGDQLIWTSVAGPGDPLPIYNVGLGYPIREWNGKIVIAFQRWSVPGNSFGDHRPAVAYADSGEANPTWMISPIGSSGSGALHLPTAREFSLETIGANLAVVWISLEDSSGPSVVNNIYYKNLNPALSWDADDILYYDYTANQPDPPDPGDTRLSNDITTFEDPTSNSDGFIAVMNYMLPPVGDPRDGDLFAYFAGLSASSPARRRNTGMRGGGNSCIVVCDCNSLSPPRRIVGPSPAQVAYKIWMCKHRGEGK